MCLFYMYQCTVHVIYDFWVAYDINYLYHIDKGRSRVGERGGRGRGAAGAEGVGFGEGVSPSPLPNGGGGCAPPHKIF